MENRFLCRGKRTDTGEWVIGNRIDSPDGHVAISETSGEWKLYECIPSTICRCTGLKDKNSKLIWENDILMCHGNSEDLVKAVFGEFNVINAETLEVIDRVIGWHYEVVPTDALSKCEPFCFPMPLTEEYVKSCEMKVVDNPELLEVQP